MNREEGVWGSRGRHFVGFILWYFLCYAARHVTFSMRASTWARATVGVAFEGERVWVRGRGEARCCVCLCGLCFGCGFGNLFHIAPHIATLTFARC